jgi:hypothetical protein
MKFQIETFVSVTAEHIEGNTSRHISTDFTLGVSSNLDESMYVDSQGMPTKEGSKAITQTLLQGLIGNIHYAHKLGYKNDAEHLREIIKRLEDGFVQITEVSKGKFTELDENGEIKK